MVSFDFSNFVIQAIVQCKLLFEDIKPVLVMVIAICIFGGFMSIFYGKWWGEDEDKD